MCDTVKEPGEVRRMKETGEMGLMEALVFLFHGLTRGKGLGEGFVSDGGDGASSLTLLGIPDGLGMKSLAGALLACGGVSMAKDTSRRRIWCGCSERCVDMGSGGHDAMSGACLETGA